jgi:hypothetical protein
MEIAQYLTDEAQKILQYEVDVILPQKLANTEYYLAKADDSSVFAFGTVSYEGTEYKIGTKKS